MDNPYKCINCTFNPSQYGELGSADGYCLKHSTLLFFSNETTCRFHIRKDLPYFVCEDGQKEHAEFFSDTKGVVFYEVKKETQQAAYSEKYAWDNDKFDPNLNIIALYHRSAKKWLFLDTFLGAGNTLKSLIHSSLTRRYIKQCGSGHDSYRIALSVAYELGKSLPPNKTEFNVNKDFKNKKDIPCDYFDIYQKDIELLKLYCIQEYGYLIQDEEITWISDEINLSINQSSENFMKIMKDLSPILIKKIITGAKKRETYFKIDR